MKKLKKIQLNESSSLDDQSMKKIVGSFSGNTRSSGCSSGDSDTSCAGSCVIEIELSGKTYLLSGSCHYSGVGSVCACVGD